MKRLLALLLALMPAQAIAQTSGVPYFPQVLPASTVIGRLSTGAGPTEAIPFSRLAIALALGDLTVPLTFQNTLTGSNAASAFTWAGPVALAGTLTGSTTSTLTWGGDISFAHGQVLKNGTRSKLSSPADASWLMTDAAGTSFTSLLFGGATTSFPALVRSAATLGVKLADNSTFSQLEAGVIVSRNTSGTMAHQFDVNGKQRTNGTAPVLSSCGTSPTISGTDRAGTVTMGTTATGCVITFSAAYVAVPYCIVSWQAQALASQSYVVAAATITTVQTSASNNKINYLCIAQSGG